MKNSVMIVLLLGILLVSPLVFAEEQEQTQEQIQLQTYSGLGRFVDNVKMLFSFGDKKVMLALEIREKELNSAIVNTRNGEDEDAEKNLERARKRLQYVQNKVSEDIAEDVKANVDEMVDKIGVEEELPKIFEAYLLEEEKTQLTAELVIEVEGIEGQTLTRAMVKDSETGQNKVEVTVDGESEQTNLIEIEERIDEIDDEIVEMDMVVDAGDNVVSDDVVSGGGGSGGSSDDDVVSDDGGDNWGTGEPGVVDED